MEFRLNFEEDILPIGEYEMIIGRIFEKETPSGAKGICFVLNVRNDVEQKYKDRLIFHTIWRKKEPTDADLSVNGYNFMQLMQLAKACGLGEGKEYENLFQLLDDLVTKTVLARVVHEEYKGRKNERIGGFSSTKFPDCKHVFKTTEAKNLAQSQSTDDEFLNMYEEIF